MAPRRRRFLVWGAGGHGRVVAELAEACGHRVVGFIDGDPRKARNTNLPGAGLIIPEDDFLRFVRAQRSCPGEADAVVPAVGDNVVRRRLLSRLEALDAPHLIHPTAAVSRTADVGRGTVVLANAVVNANARLGNVVIVNSAAIVEHDVELGDGVHVSPGAVLCGGVRVGSGSWIGAGAVVIPDLGIGANVTVGAGAVVTRNVASGSTVAGVPARPLPRSTGPRPRGAERRKARAAP